MGGEDGGHLELLESAEKKTDPCQPFVEVSDHHGRRAGESGDKLEKRWMDGRRERGGEERERGGEKREKRGRREGEEREKRGRGGEGGGEGRDEVRIFATQAEAS